MYYFKEQPNKLNKICIIRNIMLFKNTLIGEKWKTENMEIKLYSDVKTRKVQKNRKL